MICKFCNTDNAAEASFCVNCGAPIEKVAEVVQQPQENIQYTAPMQPQPAQPAQKPMGWFNFLIFFSLFAGAVLNIITSISYLTGSVYENEITKRAVYFTFPPLQALDIIYGILCIATAAFLVVTRFQLAGYKKIGPKMLIVCYSFNLIVPLVYVVIASMITGISFFELIEPRSITSMVTSIFMIVVNIVYFNNRKELFVK